MLSNVDFTQYQTQEPEEQPKLVLSDPIVVTATAYTLRPQETGGKTPSHPLYGQPAISGRKEVGFETVYAKRGVTIAAAKDIPFGTRVYIPYFDGLNGWDNGGIFEVQDRGGAIKNGRIDVFFGDGTDEVVAEAMAFGKRKLEVYIIEGGN